MSSELVQVNWDTRQSVICNKLGLFRSKNILTDVTLSCEGENFSAHCLILSLSSGYFQRVLQSLPSPASVILICGISKDTFIAVLNFMYDGTATVKTEDIPDLLRAGVHLEIPGLMDLGNNIISSDAKQENSKRKNLSVEKKLNLNASFEGESENEVVSIRSSRKSLSNDSNRSPLSHLSESRRDYFCHVCDTKFQAEQELNDHSRKIHFQCIHCTEFFDNKRTLSLHKKKCSVRKLPNESFLEENPKLRKRLRSKKDILLPESDHFNPIPMEQERENFKPFSKEELQKSVATLGHKYCEICDATFLSIKEYKAHKKMSCKVLQCQYCLKEFQKQNYSLFIEHMSCHHLEESPYQCPNCNYMGNSLNNFEDHISYHTGVLRFWCPSCKFQADNLISLKEHTKFYHPELAGSR